MPSLSPFWLVLLPLGCLLLGGLGIYWARSDQTRRRAWWGRALFVSVLAVLGVIGLIAAMRQAEGLAPLGLLGGLLVVAMLWEGPAPFRTARAEEP